MCPTGRHGPGALLDVNYEDDDEDGEVTSSWGWASWIGRFVEPLCGKEMCELPLSADPSAPSGLVLFASRNPSGV